MRVQLAHATVMSEPMLSSGCLMQSSHVTRETVTDRNAVNRVEQLSWELPCLMGAPVHGASGTGASGPVQ